ncbi:MAG: stage III sporulation protein AD [Clostridiaceae bacterium]|nr:stage III sporulation protein AD [Clostridiaceae bacterium]
MLKAAIIGVMAVFLALPLKRDKAEFSMLVILAACLVILFLAVGKLEDILGIVQQVEGYLGEGASYVEILLKMVGITYVAEFGANLCHDAGCGAVANQIEFYGKLMILAVSMPIVLTLIETIAAI